MPNDKLRNGAGLSFHARFRADNFGVFARKLMQAARRARSTVNILDLRKFFRYFAFSFIKHTAFHTKTKTKPFLCRIRSKKVKIECFGDGSMILFMKNGS